MIDVGFLIFSYFAAAAATIAGFGSSTLLIPVALMFMDVKTGVFLVACFHLFNNLFKIRIFWRQIDRQTFLLFGVPSIIFAFLGAVFINRVDVHMLKKAVAVFLLLFAVYSLVRPRFQIPKAKWSAILGGGLSGFLAGLIGLGGAIRSSFLIAFSLPKEVYIGTSAMIAFVIDLTRIPTYLIGGSVQDNSYFHLLPFLLITAFLGVRTGKALLGRISQDKFRTCVLIAVLLVALKLLWADLF